jgi:signal transduction histidine kinase
MLTESIIYLPSVIGIFLVAVFVMVRSTQLTFRLYGLFSISLGLFLMLEYFIDAHIGIGKLWLQLDFLVSFFMAALAVAFVYSFPGNFKIPPKMQLALAVPVIIFAPLSFTSLLVKTVTYSSRGNTIFQPGPLYTLQTIALIIYLILALVILFGHLRVKNSKQKSQTYFLLFAFAIALIGNVLAGYIFADSTYWQMARPLSIFIMICIITYDIIRYRLFDMRPAVARGVAYVFSLGLISFVYGLFIYLVSSLTTFSHQALYLQRAEYIGFTLIVALSFPRTKAFFAKITDKIFYRDAYDTQMFLGNFNKILVNTFELNHILKKSASMIEDNLKPTYCAFDIKATENTPRHVIGTAGSPKFLESDIISIGSLSPRKYRKLVVTDLLEEKYKNVQTILLANNISIIARLASSSSEEAIGYLIMGPKKSGNLYSSQDINVIEIITNELVIAIQNALHTEEIENFNLTLRGKVNDATRKLRLTNEKLKQLDETKDDFISMASHQLRTPLTSVKGYLSMVLEGDAGKVNSTQTKMLHQAFISSQRMVFLITDLLNVSRLKTGKFVIEPTPVDLSRLIEEEVSQLVETAQVKHIELTYDKPASFPLLMLDETKIRQVGMNFMDNAIYYTPVNGHIKVELINNPVTIELRVSDDGLGVPKSEQHHLFTKFYRATNARKARPDGTGLGLFMAKKVIAAQGGSIIFESKEGQGSTFGFTFSKAKLKVPENMVPPVGGTSLESSGPQVKQQPAKALTLTK